MTDDKLTFGNIQHWEKEVAKGAYYTRPWLELELEELKAFANGKIDRLNPPCAWFYPADVLRDVAGKKVLCLASGGGQQSAAFGLLGAEATVLDFCEGQLNNDRIAAEKHGYNVQLVHGDMRDLSMFSDEQFNLVYQAISLCFVPDVSEVYRGVHRILKPGGLYRVGHVNPSTVPVCFEGPENGWDGTGYRIAEPYLGGPIRKKDDGSESMTEGAPTGEHRHLLSDIINSLIGCGFVIRGLWEDPAGDIHATPGSDEHMRAFIQQYFCIVAMKSDDCS